MSNYNINLTINLPKDTESDSNQNKLKVGQLQDPVENVVLEVDDTMEPDELGRKKVKSAKFQFNADQGESILPVTIFFPEDDSRDNVAFTKSNSICTVNDSFSYTCTFKKNAKNVPAEAITPLIETIITYKGKYKMQARNSPAVVE